MSEPSAAHEIAILNCGQVVTCAPNPGKLEAPRRGANLCELRILPDGAVLIRGESIAAVGPRSEIERRIGSSTEVIDASGRLLMPGFVDAHTHLVFGGHRAQEFEQRCAGTSYQQIAAQGGGILSTVRSTRAATEAELLARAQKHASWFLRGGTTTIESKSGYGLDLESELKLLRVLRDVGVTTPLRVIPTFLGAHEVPEEFAGRGEAYADLILNEVLPAVAREKLAEFADVFCEPGIFPVPLARKILLAARAHGMGLRVHADQFASSGGARLAAELHTETADHLEHTELASIRELAAAGVQPVLLPGSVYAVGSRKYPAAREMISAGLAVVLATDFNPGSSPTANMPFVMSLACTQMKMTPAETVVATTINAAHSLHRGHLVGSLEVGKSADMVIHEAEDYRELPYWIATQRPALVLARGRVVAT